MSSIKNYFFITVVIILSFFGLFMLYSSSYAEASNLGLPHYYFVLNQGIYVVLGFVGIFVIKYIPFSFIKKMAIPLLIISLIFMLLTSFSSFGITIMGARRWLDLPLIPSFQPSEILKASMIVFLSWFFSKNYKKILNYIIPLSLIFLFSALILYQKAYTTTVLFFLTCFIICIFARLKILPLFTVGAFLFVPAIFILLSEGYRVKRIVSFLFPFIDLSGLNWQINMSLSAIKEGGLFGKGITNGEYKLGSLPEVQNDFIFASIVEECGAFGALIIFTLFILFMLLAFKSIKNYKDEDTFIYLVGIGFTVMIIIQVLMNISIVLGVLPPTGIPLPFFSQGGTNLLIILLECGIINKIVLYKK